MKSAMIALLLMTFLAPAADAGFSARSYGGGFKSYRSYSAPKANPYKAPSTPKSYYNSSPSTRVTPQVQNPSSSWSWFWPWMWFHNHGDDKCDPKKEKCVKTAP